MRIDLSALEIAVRRDQLFLLPPACSVDDAKREMDARDFDVIPIAPPSGQSITSYWKRGNSGGQPRKIAVSSKDMIVESSSAEYALERLLSNDNRSFLFVRNRSMVTGMLTLSDFNSTAFRIHVFAEVATAETLLSRFVQQRLDDGEINEVILDRDQEQRLKKDKLSGLNYQLCHYMYLKDMINLIASNKSLYSAIGFASRSQFEKFNSINDLRNRAAHASKSLIYDRQDAKSVLGRLEKAEELCFRLRAAGLPLDCWSTDEQNEAT